ncbi:hypothetical protein HanPSC8_Chr05g0206691 [Helianthus annuus]|nr:hypothetical protein HanPSC8_Chr05g0206691 [Helianthus annuus]
MDVRVVSLMLVDVACVEPRRVFVLRILFLFLLLLLSQGISMLFWFSLGCLM